MKEYPSVIKSHVLSGFVVLSVMIASALFPSCSVAFNETIAELYPQFQELGIVPDQVGVTEAQNSGGDLLDNGFDFGWQTEQVFLDITLENRGSREVRFDQASISGTTAAAFSLEELTLPVLLPANGTAAVRVGFAPESARYSTAILTLSNANGRVLHIQLSGSGFAQPRDTEGWNTLGLWLRADRLRKSDLSDTVGTLQQPGVLSWRSLDPLRRLATAPEDSESLPLYIPGSTGSLPSLRFDEKELLAVDLPDSQNIASGGNGTTTFIAFKTSSVRFDQRLLTATFGEASQPSFPTFSLDKW